MVTDSRLLVPGTTAFAVRRLFFGSMRDWVHLVSRHSELFAVESLRYLLMDKLGPGLSTQRFALHVYSTSSVAPFLLESEVELGADTIHCRKYPFEAGGLPASALMSALDAPGVQTQTG